MVTLSREKSHEAKINDAEDTPGSVLEPICTLRSKANVFSFQLHFLESRFSLLLPFSDLIFSFSCSIKPCALDH